MFSAIAERTVIADDNPYDTAPHYHAALVYLSGLFNQTRVPALRRSNAEYFSPISRPAALQYLLPSGYRVHRPSHVCNLVLVRCRMPSPVPPACKPGQGTSLEECSDFGARGFGISPENAE